VADALEIRPATVADVPALRALGVAAWHATYDGVLPAAVVEAGIAEWWNEYSLGAACHDGRMLVAARGGQAVGLLEFDRMADGRPVVWKLYVAPAAQRTGVGRALLRAHAAGLPDDELWLEHYEANAGAAAFSERLRFTVRAVEPAEHDPAVRIVWRALDLRAARGATRAT
jgi:ribosomal protein S18 acetylase RimI-like enzyme